MLMLNATEKGTEYAKRRDRRRARFADRIINRARSRAALFCPTLG